MQRYVRVGTGARRVFLALMDYWLLFVGYALIYWSFVPREFDKQLHKYSDALYFSIVNGTTLGFGEITPQTGLAKFLTVSETLVTFLFAIIIIAHMITLLPRAPTLENDD